MLFIIPGIILTFVLYFVAQAVMIDGKRATKSFKTSYNFVRLNLADAVIIVLAFMVISFSLPMMPVIGILLSLISLPYLYSLATLLYIDRR